MFHSVQASNLPKAAEVHQLRPSNGLPQFFPKAPVVGRAGLFMGRRFDMLFTAIPRSSELDVPSINPPREDMW